MVVAERQVPQAVKVATRRRLLPASAPAGEERVQHLSWKPDDDVDVQLQL